MTLDDTRSEAERARDALRYKSLEVKSRLKPASLLEDAKAMARKRALQAAVAILANRKARPVVAAGAVAAGAAYLLRKPLARIVSHSLKKER